MTATDVTNSSRASVEVVKQTRSIRSALEGHRNSLGLIRLVLASMVIFDHAVPLGGWGKSPGTSWTAGQESVGGFAVVGFFAISGYLIAKSGANADAVQFFWRRVLRIFPAFWTVLLVGITIVGPIAWRVGGRSLRSYLSLGPGGPIAYFTSNWDLVMRQWGISDIFAATTPYGRAVGGSVFNGSLWTLSYEWWCYVIIGVLVALGVLARARVIVAIITSFFVIITIVNSIVPGAAATVIPALGDPFRLKLGLVFMVGATLAMFSREIIFDDRLGIISVAVVIATLAFGGWNIIGTAAFAYTLIWLAGRLPRSFQWIGAKNDYSYGMYAYGFLVQQITASFGWYRLGYLPWVLIALCLTACCAWLSWHAIEKHALALKNWGPGRGARYWYEKVKSFASRRRAQMRLTRVARQTPEPRRNVLSGPPALSKELNIDA